MEARDFVAAAADRLGTTKASTQWPPKTNASGSIQSCFKVGIWVVTYGGPLIASGSSPLSNILTFALVKGCPVLRNQEHVIVLEESYISAGE